MSRRPRSHSRFGRVTLLISALAVCLHPESAYLAGALLADNPMPGSSCAVLVLGYPPKADGSPHPLQIMRMEIALRAFRETGCEKLVISGGSPHSDRVEAEVMAELARKDGFEENLIVLETRSRNTWENIRYSVPLLEGFDRILIVSDSLHVHRGRRYFCKQFPDRCDSAYAVTRYYPFRLFWLKFPGAAHEAVALVRDWIYY